MVGRGVDREPDTAQAVDGSVFAGAGSHHSLALLGLLVIAELFEVPAADELAFDLGIELADVDCEHKECGWPAAVGRATGHPCRPRLIVGAAANPLRRDRFQPRRQ
jgi:hypothetical protein